jgi:hypothetical protein
MFCIVSYYYTACHNRTKYAQKLSLIYLSDSCFVIMACNNYRNAGIAKALKQNLFWALGLQHHCHIYGRYG